MPIHQYKSQSLSPKSCTPNAKASVGRVVACCHKMLCQYSCLMWHDLVTLLLFLPFAKNDCHVLVHTLSVSWWSCFKLMIELIDSSYKITVKKQANKIPKLKQRTSATATNKHKQTYLLRWWCPRLLFYLSSYLLELQVEANNLKVLLSAAATTMTKMLRVAPRCNEGLLRMEKIMT